MFRESCPVTKKLGNADHVVLSKATTVRDDDVRAFAAVALGTFLELLHELPQEPPDFAL